MTMVSDDVRLFEGCWGEHQLMCIASVAHADVSAQQEREEGSHSRQDLWEARPWNGLMGCPPAVAAFIVNVKFRCCGEGGDELGPRQGLGPQPQSRLVDARMSCTHLVK